MGGWYGAKILVAHRALHNRTIIDEHLMTIEPNKTEIISNKPLNIGITILENFYNVRFSL